MSAIAALSIFIVAYFFIATEKINKVKVVLIAAGVMAVFGLIPGSEVFFSEHEGIDWNVIFLLFGMMIIVGMTCSTRYRVNRSMQPPHVVAEVVG